MKIAWFTPMNKKSAIGRYSKFAAEALSSYADVDIFTFDKRDLHNTRLKVVCANEETVERQLKGYDLAIYNMGDNGSYHAAIYDTMRRFPGILIDHDICLHNFMRYYLLVYKRDQEAYDEILLKYYGEEAAKSIKTAAQDSDKWSEIDFFQYSLSENIADNALGVIVHSKYHKNFLEQFYRGKIHVIPILDMNDNLDKYDDNVRFEGYSSDKTHILTVGNVNKNKRIHQVIQTLGENPCLAERFDYYVIGSLENKKYRLYLENLIDLYNLDETVHLLGFVSHSELAYYYRDADLIANLRYPAYEGASGSIVEQLAIGKACLVSDTGVYSEIEDRSVIKISVTEEKKELEQKLLTIAEDPGLLDDVSKHALEYAANCLNRDSYAKKVHAVCQEALFQKPLFDLKDSVEGILEEMPGVENTDLQKRIAGIMEELYYE